MHTKKEATAARTANNRIWYLRKKGSLKRHCFVASLYCMGVRGVYNKMMQTYRLGQTDATPAVTDHTKDCFWGENQAPRPVPLHNRCERTYELTEIKTKRC